MRLPLIPLATGLLALAALPAGAQELSLDSYRRARQTLDQALEAHGGLERLQGIQRISIRHEGTFFNRHQSRRVTPPWDPTPLGGLLVADFGAGTLVWETEGGFPGGFRNRNRLVITPTESWQANLIEGRWFAVPAPAGPRREILRRLPHVHLLAAHERAAQLRWLGERRWEGRPQTVLTFASEDGIQFALYVDRRTRLLSKVERLYSDPMTGDALVEIAFDQYQTVAGIELPGRRRLRRAGELVEEVRYFDMVLDTPVPPSLLVKPAGFVDGTGGPAADTTLTDLGEGVFLVPSGGSNSLLVEFADHLVVVEPYGSDADSRRTIARIRTRFPGKPIRTIVLTHHHDDHSGGLRTYVAEGAAVVTTPGNVGLFRRMMQGRWTIAPDQLARAPRPLTLTLVEGKRRVLADSTQELVLLDIGPSPHAEEMLVAWLPRQRILFQGDLLNRPADGRPRAANQTTRHFAAWLRDAGLPVEWIAGVHGPVSSMEDLGAALALEEVP